MKPVFKQILMLLACLFWAAWPAALAAPANDNFAAAQTLAGSLPISASGTNVDATMETNEPKPVSSSNANSVWYQWTPASSGMVTVSTNGSDFDTVLAVYTGNTLAGLSMVKADDDGGEGYRSELTTPVEAGTTYRIAVYGYSSGSSGSVSLQIRTPSGIHGKVTGPDGTTPLGYISVRAWYWDEDYEYWDWWTSTSTDENGDYLLQVSDGNYRIEFLDYNDTYAGEFHEDAETVESADDVSVVGGTTASPVNASLRNIKGGITGKVTGPDGTTPLENIRVMAWYWDEDYEYWDWWTSTYTGGNGDYQLWLPDGEYRIEFRDTGYDRYANEFYNDAETLESADKVSVVGGTIASSVNASLRELGQITGKVTGPDGTTPLGDIRVMAWYWNESWEEWDYDYSLRTEADGTYRITGLKSGNYRVQFYDHNNVYVGEYHNNAPTVESAADVAVSTGTVTGGINASLARNTTLITGKVTGPDGTTPVAGIYVTAYQWDGGYWDEIRTVTAGADGTYALGVTAGTYRLEFNDWNEEIYATEYYDNSPDFHTATDIVVAANKTVGGINASLGITPPPPVAPEITVLNGNANINGGGAVSFGNVNRGANRTVSLTIKNTGTSPLTGIFAGISGGTSADYLVTSSPAATLAPNAMTTVSVKFTPSAAGSRTTTLRIASNDADENPFVISLSGTGVSIPKIAVLNGRANLNTGSTAAFGTVTAGATKTITLTIKNTGSANLARIKASLKGGQAKQFAIVTKPAATLAPGKSTKVKITFKPKAAGARSAALWIASNDADKNPFVIKLSGKAVKGKKSKSAASPTPPAGGKVTTKRKTEGASHLVLTVDKTLNPGQTPLVEVSSDRVRWFSGRKHTVTLLDTAATLRVMDAKPVTASEKRHIRVRWLPE